MRELSVNLQTSALDEAFRNAPELVLSHLRRGVMRAAGEVENASRDEAPTASFGLRNAIRSKTIGELQQLVQSSQNYNDLVVQKTSSQGFPRVRMIEDWIKDQRLQPHNPKHTQSDLAFMIARSIARNGTAPNDFYDRAADQTSDRVADILNASVAAGLRAAGLRSR